MKNGSDGIPLQGKTEAYATEMWLDDPSAFWLHPEGPLSDTTPDEWRAKQAEIESRKPAVDPHAQYLQGLANAGFSAQGGVYLQYQNGLRSAAQQVQYQNYVSGLSLGLSPSLFGRLLG